MLALTGNTPRNAAVCKGLVWLYSGVRSHSSSIWHREFPSGKSILVISSEIPAELQHDEQSWYSQVVVDAFTPIATTLCIQQLRLLNNSYIQCKFSWFG